MADPDEYVRARDKSTGHEKSIRRRTARPDAWEILDGEPAVDAGGTPLPAKHADLSAKSGKRSSAPAGK